MRFQSKVSVLNEAGLWAGIVCFFYLLAAALPMSPAAAQDDIIDLNDLSPTPTPPPRGVPPLRVAVSNVLSPQGTVESYSLLLKYLGEMMECPVELVQRKTYLETNELIRANEVDLAFVCTSSYVVGREQFGLQLLAAPRVHGSVNYYADIIVHHDHPAESIEDLRGGSFAFTDPLSHTGHNYPKYLVDQLGQTPETFFGRTLFTYSHDVAIQAVADRIVDGASLHSIVLTFALKRDSDLAGKIKKIHRSMPFGMPPVVVSPDLDPELRDRLQGILLGMEDDPEGKRALAVLDYEGFVQVADSSYDAIRDIFRAVGVLEKQEP